MNKYKKNIICLDNWINFLNCKLNFVWICIIELKDNNYEEVWDFFMGYMIIIVIKFMFYYIIYYLKIYR